MVVLRDAAMVSTIGVGQKTSLHRANSVVLQRLRNIALVLAANKRCQCFTVGRVDYPAEWIGDFSLLNIQQRFL